MDALPQFTGLPAIGQVIAASRHPTRPNTWIILFENMPRTEYATYIYSERLEGNQQAHYTRGNFFDGEPPAANRRNAYVDYGERIIDIAIGVK